MGKINISAFIPLLKDGVFCANRDKTEIRPKLRRP